MLLDDSQIWKSLLFRNTLNPTSYINQKSSQSILNVWPPSLGMNDATKQIQERISSISVLGTGLSSFHLYLGVQGFSSVSYRVNNPNFTRLQQRLMEREISTHYSIPAWEIPWTEKLGSQRSLVGYRPWSHKELDTTE